MTDLLEHAQASASEPETIDKVSIVISKGSLEGIYPGLIMANGARMEGIDANLTDIINYALFALIGIAEGRHAA